MKLLFTQTVFLIGILLFSCLTVFAHTGSIKGRVTDRLTHKPIEGVSIFIKELNTSAITDVFGRYFLKGLKDGRCTVIVSYLGYQTLQEAVTIEDGVTTELTTLLTPGNIEMKEVSVNAKKNLNLSVITPLDITLRPVNTSQDIMRLVPGLFTSQHQGGGKAEQMFLRGFDIDHGTDINVSVDGMPVNMVSHAHGQGYADTHFIIPESVKEMDFGKGPYRIDKGNLATAGWVEFKTRNYLDNSFVKLEGGSFGYFRTVAGINILDRSFGENNQEAYVIGEYSYNRSYFDQPQNFNRFNIMAKYTNCLSDSKILSLSLSGFRSSWEASGQIPDRAVREGLVGRLGELDREGGNTSRYNMSLEYKQAISNHSSFKSNLYLSYYSFDLFSNFTFFLNDSLNGDQIHQKEPGRVLTGYNGDYTNNYTLGNLHTKTETGLGFRYDNIKDIELSHTFNRDFLINPIALGDINETNIFGYINQTFYITPRLTANLGTRFDYFIHDYSNKLSTELGRSSFNKSILSPKAGLYYNFGNNTRVYFNYGSGFHSNDTRDYVYSTGGQTLPRANSYDLGIVVKPYNKLLISAAAWILDLESELVYVGDERVVEASGRTHRTGIDLSVRYELTRWLYLDGDFNYAKARAADEPAGADYIPLAAKTTAIGGATIRFNKSLLASLRFRYMGDRPANEDNSIIAKGYTVYDAVINYSRRRYEFGLQVQNVFNTEWNEAQFDTETRLRNETMPMSGICFTPGTPLFLKISAAYKF